MAFWEQQPSVCSLLCPHTYALEMKLYAYESQLHLHSNLKAACTWSLEEEYTFANSSNIQSSMVDLKKNHESSRCHDLQHSLTIHYFQSSVTTSQKLYGDFPNDMTFDKHHKQTFVIIIIIIALWAKLVKCLLYFSEAGFSIVLARKGLVWPKVISGFKFHSQKNELSWNL